MKKLTFVMMALAMALTLSQCKKEERKPDNNDGDRIVPITLDVSKQMKADNGSRINVDPNTGDVAFAQNDVVYVGSGGKYVGKLTCRGTTFKGNLINPAMNEPLYFYFLGNRMIYEDDFTPGTSTWCSFDIIDQTDISNMAVISFGVSEEDFTGEGTYHSFFQNKGALVMFNVTSGSDAPTWIEGDGIQNYVVIDFTNNTFSTSEAVSGAIKLPGGSGERWAILLPQNAVPAGGNGSAYTADNEYTGTRGAIPAISANGYLFDGINVDVTVPTSLPEGAINAKFTITSTGKQVYFSKGNLQYQASTGTWRFAEHQGDKIGNDNSNISSNYSGWIDLFGWGTSGWNNGNHYYQPYNYTYINNASIGYGYGPTNGEGGYGIPLALTYANADWGVYNAISNGGNQPGLWYTLSSPEMIYICNERTTTSGIRFVKANVFGYGNGIILLPDDWDSSVYALIETNNWDAEYTSNVIGEYGWSQMEANGAVFLPAAGYRSFTTVEGLGFLGNYWCSGAYMVDYGVVDCFGFGEQDYVQDLPPYVRHNRYYGCSVRLVHKAN
ncbi:MAG: hypothetical protein IKM74_04275 [Bacteroidales bacterium]|nr:hypothetical protein [Bacteroidales bacterium]